jgi:hypothetical protein
MEVQQVEVSRLIQFYLGEVPDSEGRTIHDILNFSLHDLEVIHDYIQWLFPLRERSRFNPKAPLLSDQDIRAFRASDVLKGTLRKAFSKMLDFYGFELHEKQVVRSANWDQRKGWLTPCNHNFLRITRILSSLRLLGLDECAQSLYSALEETHREHAGRIGSDTWQFWTNAVCQPFDCQA